MDVPGKLGQDDVQSWGMDDRFSAGIKILEVISVKTNHLLLVMTFMSVFLFGASLYAQQEVDPTWYDPWPAANKATAPTPQPQVAKSKAQAKVVSSLPNERSRKISSKPSVARRSVARRTVSQSDLGTGSPSLRSRSISGMPAGSPGNEVRYYYSGTGLAALAGAGESSSIELLLLANDVKDQATEFTV